MVEAWGLWNPNQKALSPGEAADRPNQVVDPGLFKQMSGPLQCLRNFAKDV